MIQIPWQILAVAMGVVAVGMVLSHFRHSDCEERRRVDNNEGGRKYDHGFRDGMNFYAEVLNEANQKRGKR